ncbi:hypothetical protein LCGC14_1143570 [marine sediment metagenome]|uniref:Thymidylate synthase (FAD) n=1 Tax=marine sediment metagenome TaxID=412755 RepID=A0A0F9LXN5_9ZZZZ
MKLLVNQGNFEILIPPQELSIQLLNIECAGRTCYKSEKDTVTLQTAMKFAKMLLKRGHESVIEHSHLPVRFTNISRGFTHEMVRHRLCAFSQESTRYVDYAKEENEVDLDKFSVHCIAPGHQNLQDKVHVKLLDEGFIGNGIGVDLIIEDMFNTIEIFYRALRKAGWPAQDARQILPIGLRSEIVVSANFREWRHIFKMRTGKAGHWEIRYVMCKLLKRVQELIPVIFDDFIYCGKDKDGYPYYKQNKGE